MQTSGAMRREARPRVAVGSLKSHPSVSSGCSPSGAEPGIHNARSCVWISASLCFRTPRNDDAPHEFTCTKSRSSG